ncbi:MAG: hypothetical protein D6743_03700 [Calditrichaeota bacterium]|nr:MAG: hypothetical protein D6743_03700 [Calditrichota bacterium]
MVCFRMIMGTLLCVGLLLNASSCTDSPLGGDIQPRNLQVGGTVVLSDSFRAEGVYVWLQDLNLSTRTDEKGHFVITLPPPAAQGQPEGLTGVFNLYYYLANYSLGLTKLTVRNGEFVYGVGDIDKNGELAMPKKLEKILDINTVVTPPFISTDFAGPIQVDIHLQTPPDDSSTVVFPTSMPLSPFGTILLRKRDTGQLFPFSIEKGDPRKNSFLVGQAGRVLNMPISTVQGVLPPGEYEVIPHMLIDHEPLPAGLLDSLGAIREPAEDYLNYPVRRTGGEFEVRQN